GTGRGDRVGPALGRLSLAGVEPAVRERVELGEAQDEGVAAAACEPRAYRSPRIDSVVEPAGGDHGDAALRERRRAAAHDALAERSAAVAVDEALVRPDGERRIGDDQVEALADRREEVAAPERD